MTGKENPALSKYEAGTTAQLRPSLVCSALRPSFLSKHTAGPTGCHYYLVFLGFERDFKNLERYLVFGTKQ